MPGALVSSVMSSFPGWVSSCKYAYFWYIFQANILIKDNQGNNNKLLPGHNPGG